jgi:hypothetical protein
MMKEKKNSSLSLFAFPSAFIPHPSALLFCGSDPLARA